MKRRQFLQSVTAAAGTASFNPTLAFASAPTAAPMVSTYTPYMQAHALAWIRAHGTLSMGDFLNMTRLNPAQAEAMLGRFIKSGYIQANSLSTGTIGAIRPDWMKAQSGVAKMVKKLPSKVTKAQEDAKEHLDKLKNKSHSPEELEMKDDETANPSENQEEHIDEAQEISSIHERGGDDGRDPSSDQSGEPSSRKL